MYGIVRGWKEIFAAWVHPAGRAEVAPPGGLGGNNTQKKCVFNFDYDFKFVSLLNCQAELGLELATGIECEMEK